jgi:HupE / UreJ protein
MLPLRAILVALTTIVLIDSASAAAHPAPFTFLDVRIAGRFVDLSLVAHVFDLAHDVGVSSPETLLTEPAITERGAEMTRLVADRIRVEVDGQPQPLGPWSIVEALADRQSLRLTARAELSGTPGVVRIDARLFPYDPAHQTFVNFYEAGRLTAQTILDVARAEFTYYAGTVRGTWAVARSLTPGGAKHVLVGFEHVVMLIGLLIVGGTRRQFVVIASAFTVGHALTLTLAALNVISPPARLVDPAIALSIVYIGVDNLMAEGGRDIRGWISLAFGAIHGVGFAAVLRGMELPRPALTWSLLSFHVGLQAGQLLVAMVVGLLLTMLRRNEVDQRRLAVVGSAAVIAIGTFQFIQRVFFPAGLI